MGFEHLADVHSAWHAQGIEHDFYRRSIVEKRHVLLGDDSRNYAFVSVTSSHLVAHAQLTFAGDINFYLLDDARIDIVAALHAIHCSLTFQLKLGELVFVRLNDLPDLVPDRAGIDLDVIVNISQL